MNNFKLKNRLFLILGTIILFGIFTHNPSGNTFQDFLCSEEPIIFSNQCNDDLTSVICNAIDSADQEIFLRIYRLTTPRIVDHLANQAKNQKKLSIHYEKISPIESLSSLEDVHLVHYKNSKTNTMHHKVLSIDKKYGFLGSANYTSASLNQDVNMIIGVKSSELCRHIKEESSGTFTVNNQRAEYFSLPKDSLAAINALKHRIRSAKTSIKVAMFALTYFPIIKELEEAKKRNVSVQVCIDKDYTDLTLKQLSRLENPKMVIKYKTTKYRLHHKFAIIDDSTLIMGSVNWSERGLHINDEDLLILDNLTKKQRKTLHKIWEDIVKQTTELKPDNNKTPFEMIIPRKEAA
ncbi:phospholipase D-like domain-containing protein [Chlamydia ibidis]|uniref:phospholipase D-like domain-containing protein n=1 Tax=Chlamydia ibidis TaxID=1405396 RepID=UPI0013DFFCFD|nr:phospholipase D-like domain-containing protein [Chlamydia ibidis]